MIINKDNDGNPIGFIETLISNERVVTINATRQAATITSRDRSNGHVKMETFYGTMPLPKKGHHDLQLALSRVSHHA